MLSPVLTLVPELSEMHVQDYTAALFFPIMKHLCNVANTC